MINSETAKVLKNAPETNSREQIGTEEQTANQKKLERFQMMIAAANAKTAVQTKASDETTGQNGTRIKNGSGGKEAEEQMLKNLRKHSAPKLKEESERSSVLLRLYKKQNEIAEKSGKPMPYQELSQMEQKR